MLHCAEEASLQTILRQGHRDLLLVFRASAAVSRTSGTARASSVGLATSLPVSEEKFEGILSST